MSAIPSSFLNKTASVNPQSVLPLPASRKIHVAGSRPDIRVPMREITLSDTPSATGAVRNPPLAVYDTTGPYTDPQLETDIRRGLPPLRAQWIEERGDTQVLPEFSSAYGRKRMIDPALAHCRFENSCLPRCARPGLAVTQLHDARKGVITPEMEFIAIRENQRLQEYRTAELGKRHRGIGFGAEIPDVITPEFVRSEVARGRAIIPANINQDRKSTRLNSSHIQKSRMPSSA